MKKLRIAFPFLIFMVLVSSVHAQFFPPAPMPPPQPQYVGIQTQDFNYVASSQQTQMWCWAACIEMVLRYYGVNVSQQDIVARTFGTDGMGNPPPFGASIGIITANLNNWGIDRNGTRYTVRASVTPSMIPDDRFLNELNQRKPLIIAYGPNINSGHVVVLTAASYLPTPQGPRIRTFVVRDPFPNPFTIQTMGRVEYLNFAPPQQGGIPAPIQAVWFIDVQRN